MPERSPSTHSKRRFAPLHWVQALRGKSTLITQDEALAALGRARSVLDDPCECTGNPPTYEYRRDKRQHCTWCDGLREPSCNHEWLYHDRQPGEDYTGYCEHCPKCGEMRQIVQ